MPRGGGRRGSGQSASPTLSQLGVSRRTCREESTRDTVPVESCLPICFGHCTHVHALMDLFAVDRDIAGRIDADADLVGLHDENGDRDVERGCLLALDLLCGYAGFTSDCRCLATCRADLAGGGH